MTGRPRILLVDDSRTYVKTVIDEFERHGVGVTGCSKPAEVLGWYTRSRFDYDLILVDLDLGDWGDGSRLTAMHLLPHLRTYAPEAKVIVITEAKQFFAQAIRCLELGALAVVPKVTAEDELYGLVSVYGRLGDPFSSREELIGVLWDGLGDDRRGRRLEMLVMNLFESMPTFRVIGNNLRSAAGSVDVLVENNSPHKFWSGLSLHMAIECKNHRRAPDPQDFHQLKAAVGGRRQCNTGILVSTSPFTAGFRQLQNEAQQVDDLNLFGLDSDHLAHLVETPYGERETCLREILERQ